MEQGTYQLLGAGNKFYIGSDLYYIRQRKTGLHKKPALFISKTKPVYQYISSLFSTDMENIYTADFQGKAFKVELKQEQITIQ